MTSNTNELYEKIGLLEAERDRLREREAYLGEEATMACAFAFAAADWMETMLEGYAGWDQEEECEAFIHRLRDRLGSAGPKWEDRAAALSKEA